jgi:dienelactone hydrolase
MRTTTLIAAIFAALAAAPSAAAAQSAPAADRRATELRHLDLTYSFAAPATKEAWLERAAELRRQILVSAGLWPMPPKQPLDAQIFGLVDRGDHTVEKVYFESYPGFYVTGNLYRPKNAAGKVPAVLLPHGHWSYGRLEHQQHNSGPLRAVHFAKLGFVAFVWDMVGYNDSAAISHRFAPHKESLAREPLWGVNLLGLQLWNAIRAVDFVESLPEVDRERIGCTGESGGGTQTFLLTAVDDRIKVSAPVNMISSTMQGGSLCENAPNLRVDTNNIEIGALAAPRPMLMVSATGDWTKLTPTVEYPSVRGVYRLFGAEDKLATVQMDAPHNYNRESREAVYGWFTHWLQGRQERTPIKEKTSSVPTLTELMVFYARPRPAGELNEEQLSAALIESARRQLEEASPRDAASLARFREQYGPAFKYALMAETPKPEEIIAARGVPDHEPKKLGALTPEALLLSRRGKEDRVALTVWKPAAKPARQHTQSVSRDATAAYTLIVTPHAEEVSPSLVEQLVKAGQVVAVLKCFAGRTNAAEAAKFGFHTTYNRTDAAHRVQDILTAIAYLKHQAGGGRLSVIGQGKAGLWTLLARGLAPQVDRMAVDAAQFDNTSDEAFLKQLPIPGIRRAGDFTTAVTLAPLTPLLIHSTGDKFQSRMMADAYLRLKKAEDFQVRAEKVGEAELTEWIKITSSAVRP